MADPQIKNGYTRIANELLEAICRLNISGNEMRILLYVIRRTFGFQRDCAEISLSELSKALDMKKNNVSRSIKKLCEESILIQTPCRGNQPQTLSVMTDYEKWSVESCADSQLSNQEPVISNDNPVVIENDNPVVIKNDNSTVIKNDNHTYIKKEKENLKENIKENRKEPYGKEGKVLLTITEYLTLVRDYGDDTVERYIERMDSYMTAKNIQYSDCYSQLMLWLKKDNVRKQSQNTVDISQYEWFINRF